MSVSVCSAAVTNYHRLGDWNDSRSFLTALEAGKPDTKVTADAVSGEASLAGVQTAAFSLCPSHTVATQKERALCYLFVEGRQSHHGGPHPHDLTDP